MKKILVATDYSKEAGHALLFAMDLAFRAKAEIVLFHAFHQPLSVGNAFRVEEAIRELEQEKTRLLQDYAQKIKLDLSQDFVLQFHATRVGAVKQKGAVNLTKTGNHAMGTDLAAERSAVKMICVCKFGLAEETILVAAEAYGADLVVMGMRGAGPVSQAFLGSTVAGIIQAGKMPVLALPIQAILKEKPTFVFALDLAVLPDPAMLSQLRTLVTLFQADLKVLHLYRDEKAQEEQQKALTALQALDKELHDISYEVYFQRRDDFSKGIQEFVQIKHADLLALVPKHHTFLEILLQDTITGYMTEEAAVPLLTLPYRAAAEQKVNKVKKKSKDVLS